jgi:hypothetical protein
MLRPLTVLFVASGAVAVLSDAYEYMELEGAARVRFGSYAESSTSSIKDPHGSIGDAIGVFSLSEAELKLVLTIAADTTVSAKWLTTGEGAAQQMQEVSISLLLPAAVRPM